MAPLQVHGVVIDRASQLGAPDILVSHEGPTGVTGEVRTDYQGRFSVIAGALGDGPLRVFVDAARNPDSVEQGDTITLVVPVEAPPALRLVVTGKATPNSTRAGSIVIALAILIGIGLAAAYSRLHAICPNYGVPLDPVLSSYLTHVRDQLFALDPDADTHVLIGRSGWCAYVHQDEQSDRVRLRSRVSERAESGSAAASVDVGPVRQGAPTLAAADDAGAPGGPARGGLAANSTEPLRPHDGEASGARIAAPAEASGAAVVTAGIAGGSTSADDESPTDAQKPMGTVVDRTPGDGLELVGSARTALLAAFETEGSPLREADEVGTLVPMLDFAVNRVAKSDFLAAADIIDDIDLELRSGKGYFWSSFPLRLAEVWFWASFATLIRLLISSGTFVRKGRFLSQAIASQATLIVCVPILAVIISMLVALLEFDIAVGGSGVSLDLGDVRVSILIAAFIGFSPWAAWSFLGVVGDSFFSRLMAAVRPLDASSAPSPTE